ncbi:hypothetical protein JW905_04795, partial [bacterium]|nr:hypothetical protein [candidate division CSSED10-310 bacterium]
MKRSVSNPAIVRSILVSGLILASLGGGRPAPAATDPHCSTSTLTVANGYTASTYVIDDGSGRTHSINGFYEHVYRFPGPGVESVDLCYDAFFGIGAGGVQTWCQSLAEASVAYLDGGVLHTVQNFNGLRLDAYYFAPFQDVPDAGDLPGNLLVMLARLSNPGTAAVNGNRLFALLNFHTGAGRPEPGFQHEAIQWYGTESVFIEDSEDSGHIMAYRAMPAPDRHCTSTDTPGDNPWTIVNNGGALPNRDAIGAGQDRVCAYQW